MKIVVTAMVRDEVDVIAAWVEFHLAQDVDLLIVTDNASVDGTTEILQRYADLGVVELHHDPVHRKQQGVVVTQMARRAFTEHGADWVINADADEFWAPLDRSLTLGSALPQIPRELGAFTVPVVNLVGPPALRGAGFARLLWRDHRSAEELQAIGIHAQPTDNAVHRGDPEVTVAQGNHFVSIPSAGQPDPRFQLEVLHLPWRSWTQLERKVAHAGLAYTNNPELRPSKNHHGMADYRRHLAGRLRYAWALRQPPLAVLEDSSQPGSFEKDTWLRDQLTALVAQARLPDLLRAGLDDSAEELVDPEHHLADLELGRLFLDLEQERDEALRQVDAEHRTAVRLAKERDAANETAATLKDRVDALTNERDQLRRRAVPASFRADVARVCKRGAAGVRRKLRRQPGATA